jgi:Ca2+-transporting ATPase
VVALPASALVVGDVLTLESGDLVAADARIMNAASLSCIESALTGESEAAAKQHDALPHGDIPLGDRGNMIFMGTSVATGTGKAVVVATAMKTELGNIAGMMESADADDTTPLEKKLESFGRVLVWAALAIVTLLFALGFLRGTPLFDLFMTSVSLAVAAVPEGLPAIVTVALALGVSRMAKRRALVRKLSAVETLGSTNVICTDKTGTLTVGEMTVQTLFVDDQSYNVTGEGYAPNGEVQFHGAPADNASLTELATIIVACNNAHLVEENGIWKTIGDPTEGALLAAGIKAGVTRERIEQDLPKHLELPFDSDRKRSAVIRRMPDGKLRAFLNGAPGVLLDLCTHLYTSSGIRSLTEEDRARILAQTEAMAQQALRVLASAYRDDLPMNNLSAATVERDLVFVGLSGMNDPPRQEAKDAVGRCRNAGIRVVMITGDHPHTAAAIARQIGIASADDVAISGIELDKMSDDELRERAPHIAVYARVSAEHKLRIIHAWKVNDAVVAMTGDGVNDAPAIKGADIGIAMGKGGTEVTRQAADMIITDDNFATIVTAVEEGRGIYANIRKTLQYLLAGSAAELLIMAICVIIGLPTPLLPIHLLWINLITDGLPALCLATDAIDSDVMKRAPRHRNESIADRGFLRTMLFTGMLTAAITLVVYYHVLLTQTLEAARSSAFAVLVFAELFRAFGARSETKPVWSISLLTNINLLIVIAVSFGLQILSQHSLVFGQFLRTSSMSFGDSLVLVGLGAIPLIVLEIFKIARALDHGRGSHCL